MMRLTFFLLGLCAVVPLITQGATIDKSPIGHKKSEQTKTSPSSISSSTSNTVAGPQSKKSADSKLIDVENDADAVTDVDADTNADADVVFVSGSDVANLSEKSQKQIFNQIVPLANVKDFYGESAIARFRGLAGCIYVLYRKETLAI